MPARNRIVALALALGVFLSALPAFAASGPDAFTAALAKGPLYAALAALAGGFLVSLTPCVYPMVAVTVSVFGARTAKGRFEGALLSLSFVLGIVAMFVPLGVVAGLTGSMFGSALQSRWVVVGIAVLFVAMALSMFGAFELALPSGLTNRLAEIGGIGFKGAFLLGLACGLIASPCTGPVLTGILTFIAKTRSAPLGALAMAAFAIGLGAPFFVVGTFAVQLPKSGHWMVHVKSLLGIVLLVVALHFLSTAFPVLGSFASRAPAFIGGSAVALLVGIALGAVHRDFGEPGPGVKISKGAGVALVTVSAFLLLGAALKTSSTVVWEHELAAGRARAVAESRPMLVDFTATWCGACKELDKLTFSAPEVAPEMARFVTVKVDATHDDDPRVESVMHELGVVGLPTVVVFDSSGKEAVRYNDFVAPAPFLAAIRRVN